MAKHTIETLTTDLNRFKREVKGRLDAMQPQVQEMHDYIIEQRGYERGASKSEKGAALNINPEIIKLLILLAGIIAALVGAERIVK